MPPVEIHGRAGCPFAWRARLAAAEKGVPFRWIAFDKTPPDPGSERNPDHKSPLLIAPADGPEHPDFRLIESMVIVQYLDEAYPGPALTPTDPQERAQQRLAMVELEKLGADLRGSALADDARPRVEQGLAALEARLDGRAWLGGDAPGVADVQIWPMLLGLTRKLRFEIPTRFPRARAYAERALARPSVQATKPDWA